MKTNISITFSQITQLMRALFNGSRPTDELDIEFGKQVGETGILRHEGPPASIPLLILMTNVLQKISRVFPTPLPKILLSNGLLESCRAC